jgi:hypothetical protein
MATAATKRRNQSKGARKPFTARVPEDHGEVYIKEAEQLGLSDSDYFTLCMARSRGLGIPAYLQDAAARLDRLDRSAFPVGA